jgi:hypothetical protein
MACLARREVQSLLGGGEENKKTKRVRNEIKGKLVALPPLKRTAMS